MKTIIPCKITYSSSDECWYVESPGFYSGIMTYGDTLETAKEMAAEAVTGLLESYLAHDDTFAVPALSSAPDWYGIPVADSLARALRLHTQCERRAGARAGTAMSTT